MSVLWRESWASMANSYLAAADSSERFDHRSLQAQHKEALSNAAVALDNEEKALWLAKAAETNRPAMKRIHRAKWRSKAAQEQRATEQAVRDAAKQEAAEVYKTFRELDLEIVVDVRSFTVSASHEPVEIIIPAPRTGSSPSEGPKPLLVAPASHTRTGLKIRARKPKTRTLASAHLHSDNIFKRFTVLIVGFFKGRFVWTRRKPDPAEAEHNKRVSENYVFDDVLGYHIPRSEFEKRAKFNSDDVNAILDEITRLPARPVNKKPDINHDMSLTPAIPPEKVKENTSPKLRPPGFRSTDDQE